MICLKPSSWLASQKVDKNVQLHGRSPYGERGLKYLGRFVVDLYVCRSPYGERGLKYLNLGNGFLALEARRSPYGERGLKYLAARLHEADAGRSPYGERGLKSPCPSSARPHAPVALLTESVD